MVNSGACPKTENDTSTGRGQQLQLSYCDSYGSFMVNCGAVHKATFIIESTTVFPSCMVGCHADHRACKKNNIWELLLFHMTLTIADGPYIQVLSRKAKCVTDL